MNRRLNEDEAEWITSDEEVLEISQELIDENREAYEVLAYNSIT